MTWQVNVCAYLLVAGLAGDLPFVEVTPEGFEDVDCRTREGERVLVQMKELGAGAGVMNAAALAEALAHADVGARGAEIALVTDGSLGNGLDFTNWTGSLSSASEPGRGAIVRKLTSLGFTDDEAAELLGRSKVVHVPYQVRPRSEQLLATATGAHPAVAGIAVGELSAQLAQLAAQQRFTSIDNPGQMRVGDLQALLAQLQDAIDPSQLNLAITNGVCAPVNFLDEGRDSALTFFRGVDGKPAHITSGFDVARPTELLACAEALDRAQSVIIVGPSGSGKSVLLWRAARDLAPAARVIRVRRVQNEADAVELCRYVRLLRPSAASPVLLVADDVGRPHLASWPRAAQDLHATPHILFLAASRAEDFSPQLLIGESSVVKPQLDPNLAEAIADTLEQLTLNTSMSWEEAFDRSNGLLMEFLALLTTGHRLRRVITEQVELLKSPERRLERQATRLIATAHWLGLRLPADALGAVLVASGHARDPGEVGDALARLRDEHIAVKDGSNWTGLHELRSATIAQLLHDSPPPTLAATLAQVADIIDPQYAGWMLRRAAELFSDAPRHGAPAGYAALAATLARRVQHATHAAALLEGAERADNVAYVRDALPALMSRSIPGLQIDWLGKFAYAIRNQGLDLLGSDVEQLQTVGRRLQPTVDIMPNRDDYDKALSLVAAELASRGVEQLLAEADLEGAVRLLEAGGASIATQSDAVERLITGTGRITNSRTAALWSRLIAAYTPLVGEEPLSTLLGPITDRIEAVVAFDPNMLSVEVDEATHTARLTRLAPLEPTAQPVNFAWEGYRRRSGDPLVDAIDGHLEHVKDVCFELQRFEMITVTPAGERYVIRGFEPGAKNYARSIFPDRRAVRRSVGFQAALRRATSAQTWTEILEAQADIAAELLSLSDELPARFSRFDNAGRRKAWLARLASIRARLVELRPPPVLFELGSGPSQAADDQLDREGDEATTRLTEIAEALDAASVATVGAARPVASAMRLRAVVKKFDAAPASAAVVLSGRGSPLPPELSASLKLNARLLATLQSHPELTSKIRGSSPSSSASAICAEAEEDWIARSGQMLRTALEPVTAASLELVDDPSPADWAIGEKSWLVLVPVSGVDRALEALRTLDQHDRELAGPHLIIVATAQVPVPHGNAQSKRGTVALGSAIRLPTSAKDDPVLLPPDLTVRWAASAGLAIGSSITSTKVVERLVRRSHEASRLRMRTLATPPAPPERDASGATEEDSALPQLEPGTPGSLALKRLEEQVLAEEKGVASTQLAAAVLAPANGLHFDPPTLELLQAITVLAADEAVNFAENGS